MVGELFGKYDEFIIPQKTGGVNKVESVDLHKKICYYLV